MKPAAFLTTKRIIRVLSAIFYVYRSPSMQYLLVTKAGSRRKIVFVWFEKKLKIKLQQIPTPFWIIPG